MTVDTEKRASYWISTPYIDAYEHDYDAFGFAQGKPKLTFDEFVKRMRSQAWSWGEQSVGRQVLSGREPAMLNDRYVLAIGRWSGFMYVALSGDTDEGIDVLKHPWDRAWDVT